jgi:phosphoglycolate phosphatase-like HAD superfamily hydrolase
MIRLILFDIDGTLIKTGGAGEKAFAKVCEREFNVPDATRHLHFAGRTDPSIVRDFFEKFGIVATPENFTRFFSAYVIWLEKILGTLDGSVLPGVRELIAGFQAMSHRPVIGLLTGNIKQGAQLKLTHYRLWDSFTMGAYGDDHEDRNRVAAIARDRGSEILGTQLRGEEVLVIGDTPRDIQCARAIDAKVLAVATGIFTIDQLGEFRPHWLLPTLASANAEEFV